MGVKRTIIWAIVALLIGVSVGFGFRSPIADRLSLNAQVGSTNEEFIKWKIDEINCLENGGIWTGNGCAKPWTWTPKDWDFYRACIATAYETPPPPLPKKEVTPREAQNCASWTEKGKGRP